VDIKLRQIKDAYRGLMAVLNHPMDVKLAYRMRKITKQINMELKYIEESRSELVKKYGEKIKDKNGKETDQIRVHDANIKKFSEEFESLLDEKVKINIEKIPFECLEAIEKISPNELSSIEIFIEEPINNNNKKNK
jgi:hypothetical protein